MTTWKLIIEREREKEYFQQLDKFIKQEYKEKKIYPSKNRIFRAFKMTPYDQVKCVILGQDPYHGPGQANGLAFAVNDDKAMPPSLENIFEEVARKYEKPKDKNLLGWAKQGILLLNTVLTVEAGKANSHKNKGWEIFTDTIIQELNSREEPVIFLLWGSAARNKKQFINTKKHKILEASHPSPLSVSGFYNCNHFERVNQYLKQFNQSAIDWSKSGE